MMNVRYFVSDSQKSFSLHKCYSGCPVVGIVVVVDQG
jgi:hypothetical protein